MNFLIQIYFKMQVSGKSKKIISQELIEEEEILEPVSNRIESYKNFNPLRLSFKKPDQKIIPNNENNPSAQNQFYYQIPLIYNYGTSKNRNLSTFYLEGCEFKSNNGIITKPSPNGRQESSIMIIFDKSEDNIEFINIMDKIHESCAKILYENRGIVKLSYFDYKMAEATGLKKLIFRKRDELTNEIIEDRDPSMFLKLFNYEKDGKKNQTAFTGVNGKLIPWSTLVNTEITFIPLFQIKSIYVGGGKASIQTSVISAIVTSIKPKANVIKQLNTLETLRKNNPYLQDIFSEQLENISIEKSKLQKEAQNFAEAIEKEQEELGIKDTKEIEKEKEKEKELKNTKFVNNNTNDSDSKIQEIVKKIPIRNKIPIVNNSDEE